jgi:hypothetical protein
LYRYIQEFKRSGLLHNTINEYLKQIEVFAIAGFLADHWQQSADCSGSIPIQVVSSRVVRVTDGGRDKIYCMEDVLSVDRFEKWSNNTCELRRKTEPELLKPPLCSNRNKHPATTPGTLLPLSFFHQNFAFNYFHHRAPLTRGVLERRCGARGAGEDARRLQRLVGAVHVACSRPLARHRLVSSTLAPGM